MTITIIFLFFSCRILGEGDIMKAYLFRKLTIDGVNYYQLFKNEDKFSKDSQYSEYEDRRNNDYFYIDQKSGIDVPDVKLFNIYYDDGDKLVNIHEEDEEYQKVENAFHDKFGLEDIVNHVKDRVSFQDKAITQLVNRIHLNQKVVQSNLPLELKLSQKDNILFSGKKGSGKNTIINYLKKKLDVPYADVKISRDAKETLEKIIKELLRNSKNSEEASRGVVFIRDNYLELSKEVGDSLFKMIEFLTSQGVIEYHGRIIDFRTVTFVVLFDEYPSITLDEIEQFKEIAHCNTRIKTADLSVREIYSILFSKFGRLHQYEEFLDSNGKKLNYDEESLIRLIEKCHEVDPNMNTTNDFIDNIIRISLVNGINDINIDKQMVDSILSTLEPPKEEKIPESKTEEDYWLEAKLDEVVNKTKKYAVGQDNAIKMITYQVLENIRWANKDNVDDPKAYIKNILIRGKPGTGKTYISKLILDNLGVPYFVADATEFTETGYVGKDVEEMLVDLYHAAGDNLYAAERGVLVIDEADKRSQNFDNASHDIGGGVQDALLKLAEGKKIKINVGTRNVEKFVYFDTSRLTVIVAGAFEGIEKYKDKRLGRRNIGFGNQYVSEEDDKIIDLDFLSYGMKPQFMRRTKLLLFLNDVSKEQFIEIMKTCKNNALEVQQKIKEDEGINIEFKEDFYERLAEKALEIKQGVTGIEKALLDVLFNGIHIEDIRASEIEKIILTADTIDHPENVKLISRKKAKTKAKRLH